MEERFEPSGNESNLEMENQFLKMKMMLEHGAEFGSSKDLPPSIENEFLRSVMEYEKQFQKGERVKVFDKLGKPTQFGPVNEIPDSDIEEQWIALYEYMQSRGVELSVCSPNVSARELYRFSVEELFESETDNINMPGMMTCFIYDEFHPDTKYENTRVAVEDCIHYFFDKAFFNDLHFAEKIKVNQHQNLSKAELKYLVQNFKSAYEEIVSMHTNTHGCVINGNHSKVTGSYEVALMINDKSEFKRGEWMVGFELDPELEYWHINEVQLSGIRIP